MDFLPVFKVPVVNETPMSPRKWRALTAWWRLYNAYTKIFRTSSAGALGFALTNDRLRAANLREITEWEYLASRYFRLTFRMEGHKIRFV